MDAIGKAGVQETAARVGDDADGGELANVGAGGLDQDPVYGPIEIGIIRDVVNVAVEIVVAPARRNGAKHAEIRPAKGSGVGHAVEKSSDLREKYSPETQGGQFAPCPSPKPVATMRSSWCVERILETHRRRVAVVFVPVGLQPRLGRR